jgi:hypothetical protein
VAFPFSVKCFPIIITLVFNFLLSKDSNRVEFIGKILCICSFDNLYVTHLKSSVKEFLVAPLLGFFLP